MRDQSRDRIGTVRKRAIKTAELTKFVSAVGRKRQKGQDPNDRNFDPEHSKRLRKVSPMEFDRVLRDDED